MVLKAGVSDSAVLGVPESMLPELTEQAGLFSREDLLRLFDALLKVEADLRHATQTRFQLEMGLIELAQIPKMRSLEELIADFTRMVEGGQAPMASGARPSVPAAAPGRQAGPKNDALPPETNSFSSAAPSARNNPSNLTPAAPAIPAAHATVPAAGGGSRQLLEQMATVVQKESLVPILHSLAGAKLNGDFVILDLGQPPNEFLRRQLRDNIALITQAASKALGRQVQISLDDAQAEVPMGQASPPKAGPAAEEDVLERAKKQPAVKSFLDAFPGPVKAEKIKP